jgi:hypothetical protein
VICGLYTGVFYKLVSSEKHSSEIKVFLFYIQMAFVFVGDNHNWSAW